MYWILTYMMFAIVIGTAYIIIFLARICVRLFIPKRHIDDQKIQSRIVLLIAVALAAALVFITHKKVIEIILMYQ